MKAADILANAETLLPDLASAREAKASAEKSIRFIETILKEAGVPIPPNPHLGAARAAAGERGGRAKADRADRAAK